MRLPNTLSQRTPFRFNITPMIDVVFLLIIFFLMASYFVRSEQSRPVALPDAQQGAADDQASQNRLTITVEQDGRYSIGGQILPETEVFHRIEELSAANGEEGRTEPAPEVRIRSDRDTHFIEIRKIIEQCASHHIHSIKFAVANRKQ